jgi:nicotinamide-nucleotide amidase
MRVHLITIGDEILLGRIVNTNSARIGRKLAEIGIAVEEQSTIRDDPNVLESFLRRAIEGSDAVITTGGLGPTGDDNTKDVLARIFDRRIRRDRKILEYLEKRYKRKLCKLVQTQADVPVDTIVIPNGVGSAPGFIFSDKGKTAIALPGPPPELMPMFEEHVLPYMVKLRGKGAAHLTRSYRTVGVRESEVEGRIAKPLKRIKNIALGLSAHPFQVDIRISTTARSKRQGNVLLDRAEKIIREKLGEHIFTTDDREIEAVVGEMLRKAKLTVAVAESCTGGLIGSRITDIPGSSDYFLGGMISYSNDWKTGPLGVPNMIIEKHGAVSPQTAKAMAENVREKSCASIGLASTGIAGPTGGTEEKPVGLVYVALSDENETIVSEHRFPGTRALIKRRTSQAALAMLWRHLRDSHS